MCADDVVRTCNDKIAVESTRGGSLTTHDHTYYCYYCALQPQQGIKDLSALNIFLSFNVVDTLFPIQWETLYHGTNHVPVQVVYYYVNKYIVCQLDYFIHIIIMLTNWNLMKAVDGIQETDTFMQAPPEAQQMFLHFIGHEPQ